MSQPLHPAATTATDPPAWHERLLNVLAHQEAIVAQLSELAQGQAAMIETGRTDELLNLLGRRQKLIDRFTATQNTISDLTHDIDTRLATLPDDTRTHVRTLIRSIDDRLTHVMQQDQADQAKLQDARNQTERELKGLDQAKHARNAYLPKQPSDPRFADQRG